MDASSPGFGSWVASAPSSKDLSKPELVLKKEDLKSDEALWDLYERWCKAFNQKREPDEMARLFNKFKKRVLYVHNNNKVNANKLGLTKFCDGKILEMRANRDPGACILAKKYPNMCLLNKGEDKYLKRVFADYRVVDGKLFVYFPIVKGKVDGGFYKKEVSGVEFEVLSGKLFVSDLPPEGHELLLLNSEFMQRFLFDLS